MTTSPAIHILNAPAAIICLGEYRPRRFRNPRERFSAMIRQLKHGSPEALEYFLPTLHPLIPPGWAVAVVPPHRAGPNDTGITNLARALAARSLRLDATDALCRHKDIPKLSYGGTRTERTHFDSIRVRDTCPVEGLHIALLDDVVTTGSSIRACKTLLLAHGAASVLCIALAKTIV